MRAVLSDSSRQRMFSELNKSGFSITKIADTVSVSRRTVSDWRKGKYTIPSNALEVILAISKFDISSLSIEYREDWAHTSKAGRSGAKTTLLRHGPPGDTVSRARGGTNSYVKRRDDATDIFARNKIEKPERNEKLAEFVGIMIGDGCLTRYQTSIALSSLVDSEYCVFVCNLINVLFGLEPYVAKRNNANCLTITCSSVELVDLLVECGLPRGNKVKQQHAIPNWVLGDRQLVIPCLRGIFDTDGCIFLEKHAINGKSYQYQRMSFVSASPNLREAVYSALLDLGFTPKIRNNRSVNLERADDIFRYFSIAGSSNPKHVTRFNKFGGVG